MADPRAPTRADLAKFLPDQRTIRAFEKLFELIPDDYNGLIEDALIQAGTADARSQQAIDILASIANSLEILSKAPAPQKDTFLSGDYIDLPFNGPHIQKERRIQWNDDDGTIDVGLYNGSVLQVGQEIMYYAKNTSGAQIDNGSAVMFTGTVGASGKLTFGLAVSDGTYPADYMMGIATQDIANNAFGYVTQFGLVRGFDTTGSTKTVPETWNDGDLLYFDPAYPGELTNTMPAAPTFHVPVAVVINAGSGGSGSIFVRMKSGESLTTLNDVYVNGGGPIAGQLLIYDATQTRWENAQLTAGANVSITNGDASIQIDVASAPPSGAAGGVLSGTYPNPGFAVDMATQAELDAHTGDTSNPHSVTKTQVGLSNVTNDAQLKIASNLSDLASASTARTNLGLGSAALEDYEEGTFDFKTFNTTVEVTHTATYRRVGKLVTVSVPFAQAASGVGSGTTDIYSNLPYQPASGGFSATISLHSGGPHSIDPIVHIYSGGGGSTVLYYRNSGSGWNRLQGAEVVAAWYFGMTFSYCTV